MLQPVVATQLVSSSQQDHVEKQTLRAKYKVWSAV